MEAPRVRNVGRGAQLQSLCWPRHSAAELALLPLQLTDHGRSRGALERVRHELQRRRDALVPVRMRLHVAALLVAHTHTSLLASGDSGHLLG